MSDDLLRRCSSRRGYRQSGGVGWQLLIVSVPSGELWKLTAGILRDGSGIGLPVC